MSYQRVIPRDLFNEANLLKCYGQLWIKTEEMPNVKMTHHGNAFVVEQDRSDGSLYIFNVRLSIRGRHYVLRRPVNSREPWPLYAQEGDYAEWEVFDDNGDLSEDFLKLLE